jgi:hypothetical protein
MFLIFLPKNKDFICNTGGLKTDSTFSRNTIYCGQGSQLTYI